VLHAKHVALDTLVLAAVATVAVVVWDRAWRKGEEGRREGGKEGRREGGQEGRREGGKEGRREGGKEGRREGGKEGRRVSTIRAEVRRLVSRTEATETSCPKVLRCFGAVAVEPTPELPLGCIVAGGLGEGEAMAGRVGDTEPEGINFHT
jgi:hypothetical protein